MSLSKDFLEQLPEKTDSQLFEMLSRPDEWLPEVLEAAKEELRKRNLLTPAKVAELELDAQTQKFLVNHRRQFMHINTPLIIAIAWFCWMVLGTLYYDGANIHTFNGLFKAIMRRCTTPEHIWIIPIIVVWYWTGRTKKNPN